MSSELFQEFKEIADRRPSMAARALAEARDDAGAEKVIVDCLKSSQGAVALAEYVRAVRELSEPAARERALRLTAAHLGRNLSFSDLRECEQKAKLSAEDARVFRARAAAAHLGSAPEAEARIAWALEVCGTEEAARAETLSTVARAWAARNLNAAGRWINNQPPGAERDAAIAAFAEEAVKTEPPTAVDWALNIQEPTLRESALRRVTQAWRSKDPNGAEAYLGGKSAAR